MNGESKKQKFQKACYILIVINQREPLREEEKGEYNNEKNEKEFCKTVYGDHGGTYGDHSRTGQRAGRKCVRFHHGKREEREDIYRSDEKYLAVQ